MRTISSLFSLPVSILILISTAPSPALTLDPNRYNLPARYENSAEYRSIARRSLDIQRRLLEQTPCGVRKMPADEGEMFYLDYWLFEEIENALIEAGDLGTGEKETKTLEDLKHSRANISSLIPPQPPLLLHTNRTVNTHPLLGRYLNNGFSWLGRRDFICPSDTTSCSSIGQPNSCCENGLICITVVDTGNGPVGCCAEGSSCTDQVSGCPSGYSSCTSAQGGGCCIPGYECSGVGCVLISTVTLAVYETVTASIPSSSSTPLSVIILTTLPTSSTTTPTPSPTSSTTPIAPASSTITSLPSSIPTSTESPTLTPSAAVRPTSIPTTTITTTLTNTVCPTGYYQCSAYYNGGSCCQVGRDCALTSCPPHTTATALASDSVTVLNEPTAAVSGNGGCATGWYLCDTEGCCPSGYNCQLSECLAGSQALATGAAASVAVEAVSRGAEGPGGETWAWERWAAIVGLALGWAIF